MTMERLKSLPLLTFATATTGPASASPSNGGSRNSSRSRSHNRSSKSPSRRPGRSMSPGLPRRSRMGDSRESGDSGDESVVGGVMKEKASDSDSDSDSGDSREGDFDEDDVGTTSEEELGEEWPEEVRENTEANSSSMSPVDFLLQQAPNDTPEEGPNLLPPVGPFRPLQNPRRKNTKSIVPLKLTTSRPVFERNRCTITIDHGDPDAVATTKKRVRTYLVASDMSDESLYAIEWAIGTVLRDGDRCLIVTVMEDEKKLDAEEPTNADRTAKIRNQNERQGRALLLSKEATALVERTRINIRVTCQAIHAKNARHMLIDMIDYLEPTLVIIGSRGLGKIKGMLLGSVSNYLIQKSSVPVMVARRRLRKIPRVHKPKSALNRDARVPLEQAAIEKESKVGNVHHEDLEKEKAESGKK